MSNNAIWSLRHRGKQWEDKSNTKSHRTLKGNRIPFVQTGWSFKRLEAPLGMNELRNTCACSIGITFWISRQRWWEKWAISGQVFFRDLYIIVIVYSISEKRSSLNTYRMHPISFNSLPHLQCTTQCCSPCCFLLAQCHLETLRANVWRGWGTRVFYDGLRPWPQPFPLAM